MSEIRDIIKNVSLGFISKKSVSQKEARVSQKHFLNLKVECWDMTVSAVAVCLYPIHTTKHI